eukprot:scaffold24295_cov45-Tisochrysis_lutea.AAC.2
MAGASPIATDMPPVRYEHRMLACIRFNDKQCAQDLVEVDRATRRQVQNGNGSTSATALSYNYAHFKLACAYLHVCALPFLGSRPQPMPIPRCMVAVARGIANSTIQKNFLKIQG